MLTMSYVTLFLKGSCNSVVLCTISCHRHLAQSKGWRTFTLHIMLYTMFCFRPHEIVQVVSLHNSVFSGQPKVVHKFALTLNTRKGKRRFVSQNALLQHFPNEIFLLFLSKQCFALQLNHMYLLSPKHKGDVCLMKTKLMFSVYYLFIYEDKPAKFLPKTFTSMLSTSL